MSLVEDIDQAGYWSDKIPSADDEGLKGICALYSAAQAEQKRPAAARMTRKTGEILMAFAVRMAMLAVRRQSPDDVTAGLVALLIVLDSSCVDRREVMMSLAPLYSSAARLGDAAGLFRTAAESALDRRSREVLTGFLRRSPEELRLGSMGWKEMEGPGGLIYFIGKQKIPEGHL